MKLYFIVNSKLQSEENSYGNSNSIDIQDKQKSNAGRPKKLDVKIENLNFQFSSTNYNISAFSTQFRKQVMCKGNLDDQFNERFQKFGKKSNKNSFEESKNKLFHLIQKEIKELEKKIEKECQEYQYNTPNIKLYTLIETIKFHLNEYYENHISQKHLEFTILDDMFEAISYDNYIFNSYDFPNIQQSIIIQPEFYEVIANIMRSEKENQIDINYMQQYLD